MNVHVRRALLSVWDKTGIVELARCLARHGTALYSTGKTASLLREAGLTVADVTELTGKPEAFGGRMQPSEALVKVLGAGRLGRKGKQGFYAYDEQGKRTGVDESVYALYAGGARRREVAKEEIQRRLVSVATTVALLVA